MAKNNVVLLVVLVCFLVLFGVYCAWDSPKKKNEQYSIDDSISQDENNEKMINGDDYELLGEEDFETFETGFGMGPGLYGSGRHTSEMIGN